MENLTTILIGILTSFVASIIFLFTSPFIKRKSKQLLDWISSKNKKFSDKFYSSISRNKTNSYEYITAFTLLFLTFTILTTATLKMNNKYKIHEKIIQETLNDKKFDFIKYSNLFHTYEKQQAFEASKFVRNNFWIYSILRYALGIFTFIITMTIYLKVFRSSQIKEINKDFFRHLDIIAPYISSNEMLILKSNWLRMKSREDYLKIINEVNDTLEKINSKT